MDIETTRMTVADYCLSMSRHEIDVNRNYQRSDKVWPPAAKSFLIESILLGFPVPKLSLHEVTDLRSRRTKKEIVDGQQRSMAIFEFYNNDLRLSRTLELAEAAGRVYEQLPEDLQAKFLGYGLSVDLYLSATPEEVREAFRRINSYTVPLNYEEQRHARYQGPFKWFIHRTSRDFDQALIEMGVFGQKQIVRMADAKLWTEFCDACLNGVRTTDKRKLDRLYLSRESDFPEETALQTRVRSAMDFLIGFPELVGTELMKPLQFYSLLLATSHFLDPGSALAGVLPQPNGARFDRDVALAGLTSLGDAAERQDVDGPYSAFVKASMNRTNVEDQRVTRMKWAFDALRGALAV